MKKARGILWGYSAHSGWCYLRIAGLRGHKRYCAVRRLVDTVYNSSVCDRAYNRQGQDRKHYRYMRRRYSAAVATGRYRHSHDMEAACTCNCYNNRNKNTYHFDFLKKKFADIPIAAANVKNGSGTAIFSGSDLNYSGKVFGGTTLTAVFGGAKCDLRGAVIEK